MPIYVFLIQIALKNKRGGHGIVFFRPAFLFPAGNKHQFTSRYRSKTLIVKLNRDIDIRGKLVNECFSFFSLLAKASVKRDRQSGYDKSDLVFPDNIDNSFDILLFAGTFDN